MARPRKQRSAPGPVTAADVIAFIETVCLVPEGKFVGQPLRLQDWQKDILRAIYDNPNGTRRAIISMGRKNAKTTLSACLLLAHLCGPPARNKPNSELYSAAQSRDQAAIIFSLTAKMIRLNPMLAQTVQIQETAKTLRCSELGTRYRALSAEATTAFGLSPALIIHDELGRVRGPRSGLYEALETAVGAQEAPLSIVISTQAATDSDLLSILIDDALRGADPTTVVRLYTAPPELDPFREEAIRAANPALDTFMNKREVLAMAADAARMPARANEYKNLVLNMRVETSTPFVDLAAWTACAGEPRDIEGLTVFGGLDLSESGDLTALVLTHCDPDGVWHVRPIFWLPADRLAEKAARDHAPYDVWAARGYLETTPGAAIGYEFVAERLKEIFEDYQVAKIAFDLWNWTHLRPWLLKAGFSEQMLDKTFVPFGQGYRSMSPAVRDLETLILERKLRHGGHPVLTMCMANATVERGDAGNRKLSKKRSTGRIDGAVALMMAIGAAPAAWTAKVDIAALIG
ncbi:MAG: terminase TerL endonuclease subunit [Roseiarcus sp.]